MWNKILAINSFVFLPGSLMFLIYTCGRAILFLEWKLAIIGVCIFLVAVAIQVTLAILDGG